MIKSGSTLLLKDTYQTNYLISISKQGGDYDGYISRTDYIDPSSSGFYYIFNVVYSITGDKDHLYIGDTVSISTFSLTGDKMYVEPDFVLSKKNYNAQFVICTDNTYCITNTDPDCAAINKGSDAGKPICLSTRFYLFSPMYNSPLKVPLGYMTYDDTNDLYVSNPKYNYPQAGIAQLVVMPKDMSYCNGTICDYFSDYENYLSVTCDSNCVCKTSNGSNIYPDHNCNCTTVKRFNCNGASCVPDDAGPYTDPNCENKCKIQMYSCNGTTCIKDDNGKYTTNNCDNQCKIQMYSCNGEGTTCIPDDNGKYTTNNCDNQCKVQMYSCDGTTCIKDDNGKYTTNNCDGQCKIQMYSCNGTTCIKDDNGKYITNNCDGQCKIQMYSCNGEGTTCVKDDNGKYTTNNCDGYCKVQKYSCNGSSCVKDDNGGYITNNCDGQCKIQHYACEGTSCNPNDNGPYITKNCNDECNPSVILYDCVQGQCKKTPNGRFKTQDCNNTCGGNGPVDPTKNSHKTLIITIIVIFILIISAIGVLFWFKRRK